ncbi:MAG: hypothetical protein HQM12_17245 [SAR324 cluster bacterium]|nr:hypothetical protein [SAR324 cluster bacterium]
MSSRTHVRDHGLQSGKSSLSRHLFPDADYVTLDHPLEAEEAESNPSRFLTQFSGR